MTRTLEPLSQRDSRWASLHLGLSSDITLGMAGCYVTSFSVLAYYYGHPTLPDSMNQLLIGANLFADTDLISNDDDLSKLFGDIQYVQTNHYESIPADLNLLKDLVSDVKKSVIVEIDLGNNQVHFSPVVDCDGTTVTIMNVWDGKTVDMKSVYGDPAVKILKFVVYEGTPASNPAPDTVMEVKQSDYVKLLQKSSELDKIGLGLHFDQQTIDAFGFSDKVLAVVNKAQSSVVSPVVPDTTQTPESPSVQPLTPSQTNLVIKFLSMIGLKLGEQQ